LLLQKAKKIISVSLNFFKGDFFMSNLLLYSVPKAFDFSQIFGNIVSEWYAYLILFLVLGGITTLAFIFKKNQKRNRLSKTQKIVYAGVLASLSIVCNTFIEIPLGDFKLSLTITMGFIAGYMLGGELAFAVGFVSDLIGGIVMPQGVYNPFLALSSGLFGFIPGVFFTYFKGNDYLKTVISAILIFVLCSMFINTAGLYLSYWIGKKTFFAYMLVRLPTQSVNAAANLALSIAMLPVLKRILPKDKFALSEKSKEENATENDLQTENIKEIKEN
jgi:ECF transporter S component (folate family)